MYGVENKIIKAQNFYLQKPRTKTMFITCTEKQNVIHRECAPEGKTKNSKFYTQVLETLPKWGLKARPQFKEKGSWLLRITVFMLVIWRQWSTSWQIAAWWPSANCLINPTRDSKYFLFSKMKTSTKGSRPECHEHKKQCNCKFKYTYFICLQWPFHADFKKCKECAVVTDDHFKGK